MSCERYTLVLGSDWSVPRRRHAYRPGRREQRLFLCVFYILQSLSRDMAHAFSPPSPMAAAGGYWGNKGGFRGCFGGCLGVQRGCLGPFQGVLEALNGLIEGSER